MMSIILLMRYSIVTPCWVEKGQVKYYTYIAQSASPSKKAKKRERIWGSTAHSLPNEPISLWCFGGLPNFVSIQVRCENIQRGVRWWWYMQSCIGAKEFLVVLVEVLFLHFSTYPCWNVWSIVWKSVSCHTM